MARARGALVTFVCLLAPTEGFVRPSIVARSAAAKLSSSRITQGGTTHAKLSGDLCMRSTPDFKPTKTIADGPTIFQMDMKSGTIVEEKTIKEEVAEVKREVAKAVPGTVTPKNMELFCKAGADGESLGDCPFTQYVQMVLHSKGLPFKVTPLAPDAKPDWLVEEYEGKMPCLVDDKEAYTESSKIAEYIEFFYPDPPLSMKDTPEVMEKATEVCSGVFGALAKCIKNLDTEADPPLVDAVLKELGKVDAHLKAGGGPYICGEQMTLVDFSFAPKLYHTSTALAHFKNTIIPPEMESLHKYMDMIYSSEVFKKSSYPPDVLVWGWNNARGTGAK